MALRSLDDKLLGEKTAYYCSSSEDEEAPETASSVPAPKTSRRNGKSVPQTGPKGVIEDWRRYTNMASEKRKNDEADRQKALKAMSMTCDPNAEKPSDELDDDDEKFMEWYNKKRIFELQQKFASRWAGITFDKVTELDSTSYVEEIEKENKGEISRLGEALIKMEAKLEKNLDLLCLDLLEMVAEIDEKRKEQERYLQDGYLCLAKARYSMGVDRVSRLQFAAEMVPSLCVDCSEETWENGKSQNFIGKQTKLYQNVEETPDDIPTQSALRKRRQQQSDEKSDKIDDRLSRNLEDLNIKGKQIADPIKWFSPLPPQSLRQAQSSFIKAAKVSCEICSLESRFESRRKAYRESTDKTGKVENVFTADAEDAVVGDKQQ